MNISRCLNTFSLKIILGIIFVLFILWLFWGPLFIYSPIKIGYDTISFSKVDIYVGDKSNIDPTLLRIEELMREEEEFHGLNYRKDIRIIILKDNSEFKRFVPWLGQKGGGTAIGSLRTIYFGSNIQIDSETMEIYMKHELSHLLLSANCSFKNAWEIYKQGWFVEGIATLMGNPVFFTKKGLAVECKRRNISFDSILPGKPRSFTFKEMYFRYTFFRYFVEFFREKYGIEKFHKFITQYLKTPKEYPVIYQNIFGTNFHEDVKNYGADLYNQ